MIEIPTSDGEAPQELPVSTRLPDALPILPLKDSVPFPETLTPLAVGQERSVQLVNDVLGGNRMLVMVASREGEIENPGPDDLYDVGVAGTVARMVKVPDGTLRILVHGAQRVRLTRFTQTEPYLVAEIEEIPDVVEPSPELEALFRNVQATFSQIIEQVPYLPEELQLAVANLEDPAELAHMIAGALRIKTEERQELLEERDLTQAPAPAVGAAGARAGADLDRVEDPVAGRVRDRQGPARVLPAPAAQGDPGGAGRGGRAGRRDAGAARADRGGQPARARRAPPPSASCSASSACRRRPPSTASSAPTWSGSRSLPWSKLTDDHIDLKEARAVLDRDHYDIDKVKDRILEFLAVRKLKPDARSSILCFVGPPGVGKTSLGKSIAAAMHREFQRISVGGVRDESEIRGHRRTYIGAMPGTIMRAMRDSGSANPVLMIDEIDKMGADFRGDPASAMLEVLDPEQNSSFRDHYLDLPFDLSRVLFITTANQLDPIPAPLRDRMETIELAGYTEQEKLEIAKRYLVPRQIEQNGLGRSKIEFTDEALLEIIDGYTREAGVRNLERAIGSVCRKVAREYAEGSRKSKRMVRPKIVGELLGTRRFQPDAAQAHRRARRGHRAGLDPGGRRRALRGGHRLHGRGQAAGHRPAGGRDEGVRLRRALLRQGPHGARWATACPSDWFRTHDLHLHVPAGAIPKDGPSAGITMATALASLVSGRPVRSDTAMTGEITLTGLVLPIGGLKEKALAAQRAELKRVVAPKRNEPDVEEFPANLLRAIDFVFVDTVDEVLAGGAGARRAACARRRASGRTAGPAGAGGRKVRCATARVRVSFTHERPEESYGSEEEGRESRRRGIRGRQGGPRESVRAEADRGRRPAR